MASYARWGKFYYLHLMEEKTSSVKTSNLPNNQRQSQDSKPYLPVPRILSITYYYLVSVKDTRCYLWKVKEGSRETGHLQRTFKRKNFERVFVNNAVMSQQFQCICYNQKAHSNRKEEKLSINICWTSKLMNETDGQLLLLHPLNSRNITPNKFYQ